MVYMDNYSSILCDRISRLKERVETSNIPDNKKEELLNKIEGLSNRALHYNQVSECGRMLFDRDVALSTSEIEGYSK